MEEPSDLGLHAAAGQSADAVHEADQQVVDEELEGLKDILNSKSLTMNSSPARLRSQKYRLPAPVDQLAKGSEISILRFPPAQVVETALGEPMLGAHDARDALSRSDVPLHDATGGNHDLEVVVRIDMSILQSACLDEVDRHEADGTAALKLDEHLDVTGASVSAAG